MDESSAALREKHCTPDDQNTLSLLPEQIELLLGNVDDWTLSPDAKRIRKEWQTEDFDAAVEFINDVGKIADGEDHHPDLHLVDFRNLAIELFTHSADGLTENDFIVASKIDELPIRLKE